MKSFFLKILIFQLVLTSSHLLFAAEEPTKKRGRPEDIEQELIAPAAKRPKIEKPFTLIFQDGSTKKISEQEKNLLLFSNVIKNQIEAVADENEIFIPALTPNDYKFLLTYLKKYHDLIQNNTPLLAQRIQSFKLTTLNRLITNADVLDIPALYNGIIDALIKKILAGSAQFLNDTANYLAGFEQLSQPVKALLARRLEEIVLVDVNLGNPIDSIDFTSTKALRAISNDGTMLALLDRHHALVLFDRKNNLYTLLEHKLLDTYKKIAFNPNDSACYVLSEFTVNGQTIKEIRAYDTAGTLLKRQAVENKIKTFTFDRASKNIIVCTDIHIQYYNPHSLELIKQFKYADPKNKKRINLLACSSDGTLVAFVDEIKNNLEVWNTQTESLVAKTKGKSFIDSIDFNPSGTSIAVEYFDKTEVFDSATLMSKKIIENALYSYFVTDNWLLYQDPEKKSIKIATLLDDYSTNLLLYSKSDVYFWVNDNKKFLFLYSGPFHVLVYDIKQALDFNKFSLEQLLLLVAIRKGLAINRNNKELMALYESLPETTKTDLAFTISFTE